MGPDRFSHQPGLFIIVFRILTRNRQYPYNAIPNYKMPALRKQGGLSVSKNFRCGNTQGAPASRCNFPTKRSGDPSPPLVCLYLLAPVSVRDLIEVHFRIRDLTQLYHQDFSLELMQPAAG